MNSKKNLIFLLFIFFCFPFLAFSQEPLPEPIPLSYDVKIISPLPLPVEFYQQPVKDLCGEELPEKYPCGFIPEEQKPPETLKLLGASYTAEFPVNYFSLSLSGGTKVGISPYLDAIDYSANYLNMSLTGSSGYYGFDDPLGDLGVISKVELKTYSKWVVVPENNYVTYYIRNGANYYVAGYADTSSANWVQDTFNITNLAGLDEWTWTGIQNADFYVSYYKAGAEARLFYLDQVKLVITYEPVAGGGTDPTKELISSVSSEAEFYIDKTINYGDIILIVFLSLFLIGIVCKEIANFVFNRD